MNKFKKELAKNQMNEYLTPRQVAQELKMHKESILHLIRKKKLNAMRIGPKTLRVSRASLNQFIYECSQ